MYSAGAGNDLSRYSQTAQAMILKRWDTDIVFNGNPQIGLLLEVRPHDGDAFHAEVKTVVTRAHLSQLLPGACIQVSFNPADPTHVAISALPDAG